MFNTITFRPRADEGRERRDLHVHALHIANQEGRKQGRDGEAASILAPSTQMSL